MAIVNRPPLLAFPVFFPLFLIIMSNRLLPTKSLATEFNVTETPPPPASEPQQSANSFKPGIAVIVGILTTIFSVTFLLLLYMKHCKRHGNYASTYGGHPPTRVNSGLNRKVIGSLPIFRFSSLRGQKDGLECAVCLSKFEAEEVLRLLPKCKHAFHFECIDTWLDAHSTCPLCRYRVDPEDVLLLDLNHSHQTTPRSSEQFANPRVSGRHSSAGERGSSLEIVVEKNPGPDFRGRISMDSWNSRRKTGNLNGKPLDSWKSCNKNNNLAENQGRRSVDSSRKDGQLPVKGEKHRLEHRIIIGGAETEEEGRRRWSDVQAAEFLYLRWESIMDGGGAEEEGSGRGVINGRSVSELTGMSRYRDISNGGRREKEEERVVNRWLAWISQSQQQQHNTAVPTSSSASIVV